jgi:hypothetical protein
MVFEADLVLAYVTIVRGGILRCGFCREWRAAAWPAMVFIGRPSGAAAAAAGAAALGRSPRPWPVGFGMGAVADEWARSRRSRPQPSRRRTLILHWTLFDSMLAARRTQGLNFEAHAIRGYGNRMAQGHTEVMREPVQWMLNSIHV